MLRTLAIIISLLVLVSLGVVAVRSLRGPAADDDSAISESTERAAAPADLPVLRPRSPDRRADEPMRALLPETPASEVAPAEPETKGLLEVPDMELFDALAAKIAGGDAADREEVLDAVRTWLRDWDMNRVRWAAHALIVHGDPDHALADLLACGQSVAGELESEGKNASTLLSSLGIHVSMVIDEGVPKPEREHVPPYAREGFVQAMIRSGLYPESEDRVHFLAVALGGSDDGHSDAMHFLTEMVGAYEDPLLRELAAVNLGRVGRVRDLLALGDPILEHPPTDEAEQRVASGVLCGIYNATANRPEELAEAMPVFEQVLFGWTEGPIQDAARLEILGWLSSLKARECESLFRQLSEDPTSESVRLRARKALEDLGDD